MKKLVLLYIVTCLLVNTHVFSAEEKEGFFKKWGSNKDETLKEKKLNKKNSSSKKKENFFKPWGQKNSTTNTSQSAKVEKNLNRNITSNEMNHNISIYTGTFDTIDKEGDDKSTLMGAEHKNKDLFRSTWIGRFSPTTGAFVTKKGSIYLYSGIEADYNLGPINISPSFAPGYYEAGDGKNLGSALEFKSQIKIGVDIFKNTNLGYSYSHISNNDWGDINPGTDNQSLIFSQKF